MQDSPQCMPLGIRQSCRHWDKGPPSRGGSWSPSARTTLPTPPWRGSPLRLRSALRLSYLAIGASEQRSMAPRPRHTHAPGRVRPPATPPASSLWQPMKPVARESMSPEKHPCCTRDRGLPTTQEAEPHTELQRKKTRRLDGHELIVPRHSRATNEASRGCRTNPVSFHEGRWLRKAHGRARQDLWLRSTLPTATGRGPIWVMSDVPWIT